MRVFDGENTNEFEEIYFHENARGNFVSLTNSSGEVTTLLEYSTYGVPYVVDDAGELQEFSDFDSTPYLFQSRRVDSETSNYYFRNRFYNPELGRFLSRDPLQYIDSYNLYEAFKSNANRHNDPEGKDVVVAGGRTAWEIGKTIARNTPLGRVATVGTLLLSYANNHRKT